MNGSIKGMMMVSVVAVVGLLVVASVQAGVGNGRPDNGLHRGHRDRAVIGGGGSSRGAGRPIGVPAGHRGNGYGRRSERHVTVHRPEPASRCVVRHPACRAPRTVVVHRPEPAPRVVVVHRPVPAPRVVYVQPCPPPVREVVYVYPGAPRPVQTVYTHLPRPVETVYTYPGPITTVYEHPSHHVGTTCGTTVTVASPAPQRTSNDKVKLRNALLVAGAANEIFNDGGSNQKNVRKGAVAATILNEIFNR